MTRQFSHNRVSDYHKRLLSRGSADLPSSAKGNTPAARQFHLPIRHLVLQHIDLVVFAAIGCELFLHWFPAIELILCASEAANHIAAMGDRAVIHRPAHLTHYAAKIASAACVDKAKAINVPMNIAIVDATTFLLHFERMPGAKLTSIDIAMNKAFTAAGHKVPTSSYKEAVWPGGPAFGLNNSNGGKFMYVAGGIPIKVDGEVVGAIGCSTGTPAQDSEVAQAGVDAVMDLLKKSQRSKL